MKVLHIAKYNIDRPNGIKSVLQDIIPLQNKVIQADICNLVYDNFNKKSKDYDLIIFHGIYFQEYLFIHKKIKNIPYIIIPHCSFMKESLKRSKIKKCIFNFLAKKFYSNAQAIGFLSLEEKEKSIEVNNKSIILSNGINLPEKAIIKNEIDKINIIYMSRIDIYHKGLDLLIEAVKKIEKELMEKNIIINIYGNAFHEKNLIFLMKEIENKKLEKLLKYHGNRIGKEKIKAYQKSDLFILTSRFEGFPVSVLEALSYGLPCISTDGTNMKSMIEKYNSGWICKDEVDEISKTILKSIEEYKLKRSFYKDQALKNARDYEWEKIIQDHVEKYYKIIMMKKNIEFK